RYSDDAVGTQPGDLGRGQREIGEDGVRMLAEPRRGGTNRRRCRGELDRRPGKETGPPGDRHAAMADPPGGGALREEIHRPQARVLVGELAYPLGERTRPEGGAEEGEHLVALRALVPLRRDEVLATEQPAEPRPEVPLVRGDREVPAVARLVDRVAGM